MPTSENIAAAAAGGQAPPSLDSAFTSAGIQQRLCGLKEGMAQCPPQWCGGGLEGPCYRHVHTANMQQVKNSSQSGVCTGQVRALRGILDRRNGQGLDARCFEPATSRREGSVSRCRNAETTAPIAASPAVKVRVAASTALRTSVAAAGTGVAAISAVQRDRDRGPPLRLRTSPLPQTARRMASETGGNWGGEHTRGKPVPVDRPDDDISPVTGRQVLRSPGLARVLAAVCSAQRRKA